MTRRPLRDISSCVTNLSSTFAMTNHIADVASTSDYRSKRMKSLHTICIRDCEFNTQSLEGISSSITSSHSQSILSRHPEISKENSTVQILPLTNSTLNRDAEGTNSDVQIRTNAPHDEYFDVGDPIWACGYCDAIMWFDERVRKDRNATSPKFSLCCSKGKIQLPLLKDPPELLNFLLTDIESRVSRHFRENIRAYNMMFSFTSMGGKVDTSVNNRPGPYVFRLHGQNYHRIGSLLPATGSTPKFAQLYIYDTENEISNRIRAVSSGYHSEGLDSTIAQSLKEMFDEYNPFAKSFRMAKERFDNNESSNVNLRLISKRSNDGRTYNLPTASEVAALIVGDIDSLNVDRDIIVESQSGELKRINELHPSYLPMQYPILFPYGEDGYRENILHRDSSSTSRKKIKLTMREFFAFRLQCRENEAPTILLSRRLLQQFIVDAYTMVESGRLSYIRSHQKELRAEMYKGLTEAILRGETNPASQGKRIVLPSSFTGGARYMIQNYQDAMAICKWAGYPDLFITFTCNPKWPEIVRFVKSDGCNPEDRPDIVCRVFRLKLDQLIRDLKQHNSFGSVKAVVYTVEFQKRGLPHAHILLFLVPEDKYPTAEDIDKIISAEIPDKEQNPGLYECVKNYMIHGPCGYSNIHSPCMRDGKCSKHFPKKFVRRTNIDNDGYPVYRRRDDGRTVEKNGIYLDNRFVVAYNPKLLIKYQAHINVEWCNQSRSIKYLFKYINKGHDRVTAALYESTTSGESQVVDEIKMYYDCRYISPCEAAWRIFSYEIHKREPCVERLSFHLLNEQYVVYEDSDPIDEVINRPGIEQTMFLAWMEANKEYPEARLLTYNEFPMKFVWKSKLHKWKSRKRGFSIGRLYYIPPSCGELYYLRILLNKVRGSKCYEDIRTVNGIVYPTFKESCYALGLLDDDREYIDGIIEASFWGFGQLLRSLFATLLISNSLSRPEVVWEKTWHLIAEDILYRQRRLLQCKDLQLNDDQLKNLALAEIEKFLRGNGKTLADYPPLPIPECVNLSDFQNKLIQDELNYDKESLAIEHNKLLSSLTDEQRHVFDTLMKAVCQNNGGVFFLYGYGGTGKTYIWRTLTSGLRSKGEIVLTVASSGIASLLLPGGRTAHSRFRIPLCITEDSTCNIKQGSPLAELLSKTKLIIWDEAPMVHRFCFEALDRTLRDVLRFSNPNSLNQPFGGKVVVFGGDFRQILPVIPKGSRVDIVLATINSSYLWDSCQVLTLSQNMRLQSGSSNEEVLELREFSEWLLSIGDGRVGEPNDGEALIEVPNELLIKDYTNPLAAIVESTYPDLLDNLLDANYLQNRAILAPTLEIVEMVNDYILSLIPGEERVYLSSDSVCNADGDVDCQENLHTPDFLNSIRCSGIPNHKLKFKVGVPVMLLRNIDQSSGLCNGTRLIITQLGNHVIEAKVISGTNIGLRVFIPRIVMTPSDSRWPFTLQRRQYPLTTSFAMTINKSQGQSLSNVGLYLPRPVFSHGQFYVAISRVRSKKGLRILIHEKDGQVANMTENVVFKEIFQNVG